jgi:hypothetical protein
LLRSIVLQANAVLGEYNSRYANKTSNSSDGTRALKGDQWFPKLLVFMPEHWSDDTEQLLYDSYFQLFRNIPVYAQTFSPWSYTRAKNTNIFDDVWLVDAGVDKVFMTETSEGRDDHARTIIVDDTGDGDKKRSHDIDDSDRQGNVVSNDAVCEPCVECRMKWAFVGDFDQGGAVALRALQTYHDGVKSRLQKRTDLMLASGTMSRDNATVMISTCIGMQLQVITPAAGHTSTRNRNNNRDVVDNATTGATDEAAADTVVTSTEQGVTVTWHYIGAGADTISNTSTSTACLRSEAARLLLEGGFDFMVLPLVAPSGRVAYSLPVMAILDALAAGVPVVTWQLGSLPSVFGDHVYMIPLPSAQGRQTHRQAVVERFVPTANSSDSDGGDDDTVRPLYPTSVLYDDEEGEWLPELLSNWSTSRLALEVRHLVEQRLGNAAAFEARREQARRWALQRSWDRSSAVMESFMYNHLRD